MGLRGKDQKRTALRDERSGAYDRGATGQDLSKNIVPGNDMPEGLTRKRKGPLNRNKGRGEAAPHVPQNK
jgi:hypothetical protein